MSNKLTTLSEWLKEHYMVPVWVSGFFILLISVLFSVSILYGYWSNGLWGTHFELSIGFSGIGMLISAVATLFGLAAASTARYKTDSQDNSTKGSRPYGPASDIVNKIRGAIEK